MATADLLHRADPVESRDGGVPIYPDLQILDSEINFRPASKSFLA
jgi:hypothetical protein